MLQYSLIFALGLVAPAALAQAAPAPAAKPLDWTRTYTVTPEGGFAIGNPRAPLTVTEYGSYTCSHCAEFAINGVPKMMKYIATGRVRYEFRSFLRNSLDIVVSQVTYCQSPQRFWRLSDLMFHRMQDWGKGFNAITPEQQKAWEGRPMLETLPLISARGGFTAFLQQRGLPAVTTNKCLSSGSTLARLQAVQKVAYEKYTVQGTPTFLLNGVKVEDVNSWESLEPRLKAGK